MLKDKYPDLCIIPMIHNVDVHWTEHLPLSSRQSCYLMIAIFQKEKLWVLCKYNHWKFLKL